jgi:hypothetical protein
MTLVILYLFFCFGICVNLIPGHTYYEHSVLAEKLGVIELYHYAKPALGVGPYFHNFNHRTKFLGL